MLAVLDDGWDMMVAHPPCTYSTLSGVRWLYKGGRGPSEIDPERWALMEQGAEFFRALLDAPIPRVAVENPIMHRFALAIVGRRADQIVQPYMFGHPEIKTTGLWLRNLPRLQATNVVERPATGWANTTPSGRNNLGPSPDRWKIRSRTYEGLAAAMAAQWGNMEVN